MQYDPGAALRTVRRWIAENVLPSTKISGARLVPRVELERLLAPLSATIQDDADDGDTAAGKAGGLPCGSSVYLHDPRYAQRGDPIHGKSDESGVNIAFDSRCKPI